MTTKQHAESAAKQIIADKSLMARIISHYKKSGDMESAIMRGFSDDEKFSLEMINGTSSRAQKARKALTTNIYTTIHKRNMINDIIKK